MDPLLQNFAERLMGCPAVPFHESHVANEALRICREHHLNAEVDSFGNILVRLGSGSKSGAFVLAAHLDHPGFIIRKKVARTTWSAEFLGGVGDDFFKKGIAVRLMPGAILARLGKRLQNKRRLFELRVDGGDIARPEFAVWDLRPFELKDGKVFGRSCDDLIGAATILDVLVKLAKARTKVNVVGVLSRAEEVGFQGALAVAEARELPSNSLVISLETSRELPGVKMGNGVIIRVGDWTSIFDSVGTRFLAEVARKMVKKKDGFKFQRALMSGGTCEGTAYQEFGYRSAAVCVALGNYHNCAADGTIQAEYVSLDDAESMSALLVNCAREFKNFSKITGKLPKQLHKSAHDAGRLLRNKPLSLDQFV